MSAAAPRTIPRRLFDLALPVIGLNVLNVLAIVVDTLMCARLPEAEVALAALGYSTQVVFLLMTAMFGLSVGTVALISRAHGAGAGGRVDHLLTQSTQLTVLLGVAVAAVGNALAAPILGLLGASDAVLAEGLAYLRPHLTFAAFAYVNVLMASVLRGVGNTRVPFAIALVVNVVNFLLNYGLILGNYGLPALGVQGAAIGSVVAYAVGAVLYLGRLTRANPLGLRLARLPARVDRALAGEILRVGAPAALDSVILNVSFLAVIGMLGRLDEIAVAAHGVGLRIQGLAFVPGLGVSMATSAMIGQSLGAGRVGEARAVLRAAMGLCLVIMTTLGLTFVVGVGPIVGLFDVTPGSPLDALTRTWIRVLGAGMPIFGVHIAFVGLLQGAGATRTALGINAASTFAVQIPLAWVLAFPCGLGPLGVWLSFPLGFTVKGLLELAAYRRGRWARTGVHA